MEPRKVLLALAYLLTVGLLAYRGWRATKDTSDYLVAGRSTNSLVVALSYGATFVSAALILSVGGLAARVGMSLLWLPFAAVLVGVFIGFVVLGGRTCGMGRRLDAQTFPELLGRRYGSRFIQVFAGLLILVLMPLFAAVVLVAGAEAMARHLPLDYGAAVLVLAAFVGLCVALGGLKGVMSAHVLQGGIVFVLVALLVVAVHRQLGGVTDAHQALAGLAPLVPDEMQALGHRGWTAMPEFGWGARRYELWWTVVSGIALGLGVGMLAQPQLVLRFMAVKGRKQLRRAVVFGGVFVSVVLGGVVVVGSLSNAYFAEQGELLVGRPLRKLEPASNLLLLQLAEKRPGGTWAPLYDEQGRPRTVRGKRQMMASTVTGPPAGFGAPAPAPATPNPLPNAVMHTPDGGTVELCQARALALHYAGGKPDRVIPTYVEQALPELTGMLAMIGLIAAAMGALASQVHVLGASIGHDLCGQFTGSRRGSPLTARVGVLLGTAIAAGIAFHWPDSAVLARATAIFSALCACAFLPAYVGGLFWRRMTRAGAAASMVTGLLAGGLWLLLVKAEEAGAIGLAQKVTGGHESILHGQHNWPAVHPVLIALPIAVVAAVAVSLLTAPPDPQHVALCFGDGEKEPD